jgi:hypothetical protein
MKTIKDKNYSFNHVKKRLTKRYNIDITMSEYDDLCKVKICKVKMLGFINKEYQKNDTQQIYDVVFKGKVIRVVWSDKRQLVTTVLPKVLY